MYLSLFFLWVKTLLVCNREKKRDEDKRRSQANLGLLYWPFFFYPRCDSIFRPLRLCFFDGIFLIRSRCGPLPPPALTGHLLAVPGPLDWPTVTLTLRLTGYPRHPLTLCAEGIRVYIISPCLPFPVHPTWSAYTLILLVFRLFSGSQ